MKKHFVCCLVSTFIGCAEMDFYEEHYGNLKFTNVELTFLNKEIISAISFVLNLTCDGVFNTGSTNDWSMQNVSITTSVSIIQGKVCRITLKQYFDGVSTYTPVNPSSPLVINVASNGAITTTSAIQYTNGATPVPLLLWFAAAQGVGLYSIVMNYANNAISVTSSLSPTNIASKTISLSLALVTAPTVTTILVTQTVVLFVNLYTLSAVVTGATGCKYIDNSGASPPYNPSNWISVNSAYNNASAVNCPVLIPGSGLLVAGNWNNLWKPGVKTLVMWANTLNGVNAYTTSNIGP